MNQYVKGPIVLVRVITAIEKDVIIYEIYIWFKKIAINGMG